MNAMSHNAPQSASTLYCGALSHLDARCRAAYTVDMKDTTLTIRLSSATKAALARAAAADDRTMSVYVQRLIHAAIAAAPKPGRERAK